MIEDKYDFMDKDWIRRYVTGLVVFGGGTITRAATHAIDRLMSFPDKLDEARQPALSIDENTIKLRNKNDDQLANTIASDREALLQIIFEALRFRPCFLFS